MCTALPLRTRRSMTAPSPNDSSSGWAMTTARWTMLAAGTRAGTRHGFLPPGGSRPSPTLLSSRVSGSGALRGEAHAGRFAVVPSRHAVAERLGGRQAGRGEGEPAQRFEVFGQAGGAVVDVVRAGCQQLAGLAQVAGQGFLAGPRAPGGGVQCAVGCVVQVAQAQRRLRWAVAVAPQPGVGVEPVVGQQPVAVGGDQVDCVDEVAGDGAGDEVVEVDPGPAGLDALAAVADLGAEGM